MKNFIILILALSSFSLFAKKGIEVEVQLSPAGSFTIKSSRVVGKISKVAGKYEAKKITVSVKSMKSGIKLRDDHMREKLISKKQKKVIVTNVKAQNGRGSADITIKGVKKKIKNFNYKVASGFLNAKFKLSLKDFNIKDVKYLGIGAKDVVSVQASIPIK